MFLPPWPSQNERLHLQTTRHKGNYSGRTRRVTGRETIPLRNSHLRRVLPLMHSMASVLSLLLEMKRRKYSSWTCKTLKSPVSSSPCNVSEAGLKFLMLLPPPKSWKTGSLHEFQLGEQIPSGDTAQHRLLGVPVLTHGIRFNFLLFFPRIIECF